ncbi:MAG: hypothetical protein JWM35_1220, partial [Verrucomicrobia bacterium]|nr:hypothetical protein [Verrucomicrobiota bacterium]
MYLAGGMGAALSAKPLFAGSSAGSGKSPAVSRLPLRVGQVNTRDIRAAVDLGCKTMCSVFNPDDDNIPYFSAKVWPEPRMWFSSAHSEAHIPGRHLNALLSAESALGLSVPEFAIENHARAAFFSFSGPVAMPLNRQQLGGPLHHFYPHNIREGLHAMYALARFRNSAKAREVAERCIAAMFKYWSPDRGWDRVYFEKELGLVYSDGAAGSPFIAGIARAIGPLVKYYKATHHQPALDLAVMLKEKALAEFFLADGAYDVRRLGIHTHSITCVLSSLAQLYEVTGERRILERVRGFFGNGLKELSDEIGWAVELTNNLANPDRGEANCTGDILETCLILGANGHPEYLGRAERILRCHLLPSQLRDVSFVPPTPVAADEDGKRNVAERLRGAFGFPAPYGHQPVEGADLSFNLDIVGGAVGSLCEAYSQIATRNEGGHVVGLLFDHETKALKIESPYPHGILSVTVKETAPLSIRVPAWVDRHRLVCRRAAGSWSWRGDFLHVADPSAGEKISVTFELKEQELVLRHRTRSIRARVRADEILAMENFGARATYFDP